jgi:hypothetical protein
LLDIEAMEGLEHLFAKVSLASCVQKWPGGAE